MFVRRRQETENEEVMGWRTHGQLMVMHNQDLEFCLDLETQVTKRGLTRRHPDAPDNPKGKMYWVCIDIKRATIQRARRELAITGKLDVNAVEDAASLADAADSMLDLAMPAPEATMGGGDDI